MSLPRIALICAMSAMLAAGFAAAQGSHEHHQAPPESESEGIPTQLTRRVSVLTEGGVVEVDVLWATPALFAYEEDEIATAEWRPDAQIVFRLDETSHEAGLPATSVADGARLVLGGQVFEPERIEVADSVEGAHQHRLATLSFPFEPYQAGLVALRFADGTEATWDGGAWFGMTADERIIEVRADADGFHPSVVEVSADERVVFVFQNDSDREHHFHVLGLEPIDLRWMLLTRRALEDYQPAALERAERVTGHICTSATGICRLATNVHLHANPHEFDSVGFVAGKPGTYTILCPLHESMRATLVVR